MLARPATRSVEASPFVHGMFGQDTGCSAVVACLTIATPRGEDVSADNWGVCPRCKAKALADLAALNEAVEQQYGQVSMSDHDELRAKRDTLAFALEAGDGLKRTFREDYEIGVDADAYDGVLYISYRGRCSVDGCGCGVEFTHTERVS